MTTLQEWMSANLPPEKLREVLSEHGGRRHYLAAWTAMDRPGRDLRICEAIQSGMSYAEAARAFGLSERTVRRLHKKKLTPAA